MTQRAIRPPAGRTSHTAGTMVPGFGDPLSYNGDMVLGALLGALINLGGTGRYVHWGFIQLSVANLVVILLMIVVFILAILLPFPRRKRGDQ